MLRSFLLLVGAGLAACGGTAPSPTCRPLASVPAPVVRGPAEVATADRGSVSPGATVEFTVTLTGPVTYMTDCSAPLQFSINDSVGLSVETPTPPPQPSQPCGTVTLRAGQQTTYGISWTPDPTLPSGTYTATLELGDRAPLQLAVPVQTLAGGCT